MFTQQQYSRLGLRETAGVGTSVIVVRATDRDTGESDFPQSHPLQLVSPAPAGPIILRVPQAPPFSRFQAGEGLWGQCWGHLPKKPRPRRTGVRELSQSLDGERGGLEGRKSRFLAGGAGSSWLAFGWRLGRSGTGKGLVTQQAEACLSSQRQLCVLWALISAWHMQASQGTVFWGALRAAQTSLRTPSLTDGHGWRCKAKENVARLWAWLFGPLPQARDAAGEELFPGGSTAPPGEAPRAAPCVPAPAPPSCLPLSASPAPLGHRMG